MSFKTFQYDRLALHFLGDEEILLDMITALEEGHMRLLEGIAAAIKNHDRAELVIKAHTFKGIMSGFFASIAYDLCLELEEFAKGNNSSYEKAQELYLDIEDQVDQLITELRTLKIKLNKA